MRTKIDLKKSKENVNEMVHIKQELYKEIKDVMIHKHNLIAKLMKYNLKRQGNIFVETVSKAWK